MFNTLIIKWIAAAVLAAAFSTGIYTLYSHIKSIGHQEAALEYAAKELEAQERLARHINTLEILSKTVVDNNAAYMTTLNKDIKAIITSLNNKPPYVIVNGKCLPSQEFTETYNKIVDKANE